MGWLGDTVFSIREASTQNLKKLTEVFGVEWASTAIIPKVVELGRHPNYLYRMTTCFAISVSDEKRSPFSLANFHKTLAPVLNLSMLEHSVLPVLDKLAGDAIPNIRFNVAKSYAVLIDVLKRLPENGTIFDLEKQQKTNGIGPYSGGSPRSRQLVQTQILPHLEKLQSDDDIDVRYFAMTAAQTWGNEMSTSP